jgi:hypothetical protein
MQAACLGLEVVADNHQTGLSDDQVLLSTDTGTPLISSNKSLESYGLKGADATIYLTVG